MSRASPTRTPLGPLRLTYRTPDGTVEAEISMDRWDELHDRLEARGLCPAWDGQTQVRWARVVQADQRRREVA